MGCADTDPTTNIPRLYIINIDKRSKSKKNSHSDFYQIKTLGLPNCKGKVTKVIEQSNKRRGVTKDG